MSNLLILHDSPDFGGHEVMLLSLLPGLVEAQAFARICFVYPAQNVRLATALEQQFPTIVRRPWPFTKRRGEPYLRHFRRGYRAAVRRLIAEERADTVLLIQGRIENGATAMLGVPRSVRLVSYIPMAHRLSDMGRSGLVGDRIRRPLYRRPDAFIVPAPAVARQLEAAGASGRIHVAPNTVARPPATDRQTARRALGLAPDARIALFLGRLDPAQKGLDRLATATARMAPDRGWQLLVVGDGPGKPVIEGVAATIVPWTDRADLYLAAANVLLMPSRWEGLPLVALEAMTSGLPILASRIDTFADMLPPDHLFDWENGDLAAALDRLDAPDARARFAAHAAGYLAPLDIASARRAFVAGVTGADES
ncbi:glycosyltransferase involved in cell wall biosynthesis [Sphingomonas jinjuensis]|uniref:Glycosyltransferase involved in cell wall biosynthesis n=1 Tax=Sphingomonas jinjuensis TaxID=535907 RepID=A0A840FFV8_9SPHN|nr:glycosyltransferase family 4 protein [Sphingomonas jinjuensis]MBB4152245.1 glycosyltransferase involved in cell wall biosynthesis [Sphingomonas jinjuensis]